MAAARATGYIKVFQGTPLLMQLFLAFFVPGLFGWSVDPWIGGGARLVASRQRISRRDLARRHRERAERPMGGSGLAWTALWPEDERWS